MRIRRLAVSWIAPLALVVLAAACGGSDDPVTPTPTPAPFGVPIPDPTATATADAPAVAQVSPYSLPTRDIEFSVQLPAGTAGPVSVRVFGAGPWEFARSVELTEDGDRWTGAVPLEEGALVRYVYDRGSLDDFASLTTRRETPAPGREATWRIIHVAPDLTSISDTVAMWADQPASITGGIVTGVVTDLLSGEPVMDAEVSVGGVHTATDFDGRYRLEAIAPGDQLVTVHRATGDYHAVSQPVTVEPGAEVGGDFQLQPARPLTVQIQAILPEDMPAGAVVKLYGDVWQAGAHFYTAPSQPEGLRLPVARTVRGREGERVQIGLDLHEGQAVTYRYTLAGPGLSSEQRLDGDTTARSFIASRSDRARVDEIEAFRPAGQTEVVLRASVPANTPGRRAGPVHHGTRALDDPDRHRSSGPRSSTDGLARR